MTNIIELSKVKAVLEASSPKNVPELRSLGLVNYYGKFLPDLASVLAPLYALLQKKKWKWGAKQQQAFDHVKNLSRVRVHFDDKLPLVLSCDALYIIIWETVRT